MATLLFLGSGSAYTVGADNFQSNMLLTSDQGNRLLIDCGSDIRLSLYAVGRSYRDITDIYVSHLHSDHVGGLEYIGFSCKFDPQCDRPTLHLSQDIADDLWEHSLSGGMRSIHQEVASLKTFFDSQPVHYAGSFLWDDLQLHLVPMHHVHNGLSQMPTYGLFFKLNNTQVFITADTRICLEENRQFYETADVIFHDCETAQFPTPVHAHYNELKKLPESIRCKMWLYGYQPGVLPDATLDGFKGFVRQGQQFEFSNHLALLSSNNVGLTQTS